MPNRIPVTILTGFLGSGKTTLLRKLLTNSSKRLAVLINEFGSVGLDGDLIKTCGFCPDDQMEERVVELTNGCLCCTVQEDFLPTMEYLLSMPKELDGIVVETSGLALPKPLLKALDWQEVRTKVHVSGVVTLVDGEALFKGSPIADMISFEEQREKDENLKHINSVNELFVDQLESADLVLITRADCLSKEAIDFVVSSIKPKISKGIPLISISNGNIEPSLILGLNHSENSIESDDDHHHVDIFSSCFKFDDPLDENELVEFLKKFVVDFKVIRLKGRLWIPGKSIPLQIQMVGPRFNSWYEAAPGTAWRPKEGGLDLILLSFVDNASKGISDWINRS